MSERELLVLAAKAAGIQIEWKEAVPYTGTKSYMPRAWLPLADDGDCARMECALGLCIVWHPHYVEVFRSDGVILHAKEYFEDHPGCDKNHVRRLASTRCAAEIGRKMK